MYATIQYSTGLEDVHQRSCSGVKELQFEESRVGASTRPLSSPSGAHNTLLLGFQCRFWFDDMKKARRQSLQLFRCEPRDCQ